MLSSSMLKTNSSFRSVDFRYTRTVPAILPLFDGLIIIGILYLIGVIYMGSGWTPWQGEWATRYLALSLLAVSIYYLLAIVLKLYKYQRYGEVEVMLSYTILAWVSTLVLLISVGYLSKLGIYYSRAVVMMWFIVVAVVLVAWRIIFSLKVLPTLDERKIRAAVVGDLKEAQKISDAINSQQFLVMEVVGYYGAEQPKGSGISWKGDYYKALEDAKLGKFDLVYLCVPMEQRYTIQEMIKALSNTTVSAFYVLPSDFLNSPLQPSWHYIGNSHAVSIYESPHFGVNKTLKRVEDLVFSSLILILIAVPMLFIALAIKLTSPGPILFTQRRYGLAGKEFYMYKFRTMTTTDDGAVVRQATSNDSRVTPLGRFLRKYSLDELPQFLNVIKGDMSVVGPRPHAIAHNEKYREIIPGYMLRHKVKPGITGLAQISGARGETETVEKMEQRVRFDLRYINDWSLFLDVKIILLSVVRGFTGPNVY